MRYIIVFIVVFMIITLLKNYVRSRDKANDITTDNDTQDERYNAIKAIEAQEIDQILDKVSEQGADSLSNSERNRLDKYSKR